MRWLALPLLAAGLVAVPGGLAQDDAKKDQERFQGTWQMVRGEQEGKTMEGKEIENIRLVFTGDTLFFVHGDKKDDPIRFKLDPAKKPAALDLTHKDKVSLGIYAFDKDTLKLCYARPGKDRPTEFTAPAGSQRFALVLKRAKP
jgi:uncharacterized protein (TIGR03067 family)